MTALLVFFPGYSPFFSASTATHLANEESTNDAEESCRCSFGTGADRKLASFLQK